MMRVLIIEDEIKTAEYLQQGLSECGYIVDYALTGADGLHLFRTQEYELVLLDVNLPEKDGWSILQEIRLGSDTRIIMLTVWSWERTTTWLNHLSFLSSWRESGPY